MRIKSVKATLVVDTSTLCVLGAHTTVTRKHDSRIALPLLERLAVRTLVGDKGYDCASLREALRRRGVRPVIPHREFDGRARTWNARLDRRVYGRRAMSETVFSGIKRRYGDRLASRKWNNQFKDVLVRCLVWNLERTIVYWVGILQSQKSYSTVVHSTFSPVFLS